MDFKTPTGSDGIEGDRGYSSSGSLRTKRLFFRIKKIDITERVGKSARPFFTVRLRAMELVTKEITSIQGTSSLTETDNRHLAALKTKLQWLKTRQEYFSAAIEVMLTNKRLRRAHNVTVDDRALSDVILGMRDLMFTEVQGGHTWYLSKPGYSSIVPLQISEAERRRMQTGMFIGNHELRALTQIQQEEGYIPLAWLDSDIYFRKAIPAIVTSFLECRTACPDSELPLEQILDLSLLRISFVPEDK